MTARANSVVAEPDPARSPAAAAHPSGQQQGGGHTGQHSRVPRRTRAHPARDDPVVIDLVTRATNGDKRAWDLLIERYSPLIWSICRRHRLGQADAEDVGQSVWLNLLERLDKVRDPAALPGWLSTTARRECLRVLGRARGPHPSGPVPDLEKHPGRARPDGRAGAAGSGAPRGAARGVRGAASRRPAADHPARGRPAGTVRRDQRQAGHSGGEHRAEPRPLP